MKKNKYIYNLLANRTEKANKIFYSGGVILDNAKTGFARISYFFLTTTMATTIRRYSTVALPGLRSSDFTPAGSR